MGGFVKLWRQTLDSGLMRQRNVFCLFSYCLLRAKWKKETTPTKKGPDILWPGQFAESRHVTELALGMAPQEVRTAMETLVSNQMITIESTNKKTKITVVNWSVYQSGEDEETNQSTNEQQTNNKRTTNAETNTLLDQGFLSPKKDKKEKKVKNDTNAPYGADFDAFWKLYPNKTGKDAAAKAWVKAKPVLADVLTALGWQRRSWRWTKEGGDFVPNPSTYLNQGRWKDENPEAPKAKPKAPVLPAEIKVVDETAQPLTEQYKVALKGEL